MKRICILFLIITITLLTAVSCLEKDNESELERFYTKSIERISTNDFETELIDKAEKYYPSRDSVIKAAGSDENIPESGFWYFSGFDGVKIPYAITNHAIDYYSDLIDELNNNSENNFLITASFDYLAEVNFHNSYTSPSENSVGTSVEPEIFSSAYVVELTIKWEQYCGPLCAMWINKKRIVVFNQAGQLLRVFLDGPVSVAVS